MGVIRTTDMDGSTHGLKSREGANLMKFLRYAGLGIEVLETP
tara:strand:- start:654 stop:779 length:126 start_codon:yes stop_codon:yes gene_type:complete